MQTQSFLKASKQPLQDISLVAYPGQDPQRKMYRNGYEHYFDSIPVMNADDPLINTKVMAANGVMDMLSKQLLNDFWWISQENVPGQGEFNRTILALEEPITECSGFGRGKIVKKEGAEIVLARWGDDHTSPVHGHTTGFIHESMLFGKMRVNTYRMTAPDSDIVRPLRTEIIKDGVFLSRYTKPNTTDHFKRQTVIHNFTSIGFSATLHYLSEHTRDGRDNSFKVEHFEDAETLTTEDVTRITAHEGMYLRKGDVVLVRSTNVPEYGDHFIVVTGVPINKDHGLRVQEVAIQAKPTGVKLLDLYDMQMGLTLLKLNHNMKELFHLYHGITMVGGEVVFPEA